MISHILISVAFFIVLMILSVNLLGFLVRGLFVDPEINNLKETSNKFIKSEIEKSQHANKTINVLALILIFVYFYLLFHFWNIGIVFAGIIIMVGRLPDLIWEIKHGRKVRPELMNKNALYYISAFLPWLAIPILYFSLY